jgi:PEP-CTERM motif
MSKAKVRAAIIAVLAASATLAAQPAAAAIMLLTRTAVITGVNRVSEDLVGETFTLTLKYDTDKGETVPLGEGLQGARFQSKPGQQSLLSATYSFGTYRETILAPVGEFGLEQVRRGHRDEYSLGFVPPPGAEVGFLTFLRGKSDAPAPLDFAAPLDLRTIDDGLFAFAIAGGVYGSLTLGDEFTRDGTLRVEELSAAVPEPATWALMITGFGLAGGALRQRRLRAVG